MQRFHTSRALLLCLVFAACAPGGTDEASPTAPDGAELYRRQSCAVCHGPHGEGSALAPPLRDLRELWSVAALAEYLIDPVAYAAGDERLRVQAGKYPQMMPKYGALDAARRAALAEHVLELSQR